MSKQWLLAFIAVSATSMTACVSTSQNSQQPSTVAEQATCSGTVEPPAEFAAYLAPTTDDTLLQSALGDPTKGGLCQGKVYKVTQAFTIYRAWNSTNPGSEKGSWWALYEPQGSTAQYRTNYEICYQWSPIDMMTRCQIASGTVIVIGTGQSAYCSEYLTYPTSASQQIYMDNAADSTNECITYQGMFNWQPL